MANKKFSNTIIVVIIFSVAFLSIGYGALQSVMEINGSATIGTSDSIYIKTILNKSFTNNATESFNPTYLVNTMSIGGTLPNLNSKAVYYVQIENKTGDAQKLNSITKDVISNDDTQLINRGLKNNIYI